MDGTEVILDEVRQERKTDIAHFLSSVEYTGDVNNNMEGGKMVSKQV